MKRPCPIQLDRCPDADSPVTNVSAEAADPLVFFGTAWPQYDPYSPAPIFFPPGSNFTLDCQQIQTITAGSQDLANLLAQALGINCPNTGAQYANDEQTASATCANGSTASYTVPAGTLVFNTDNVEEGLAWVAYANAWAFAYALDQVSAQLVCISPPPSDPDNPPTSPHRRGGPSFGSSSAWICLGDVLTQEENTYSVSGSGTYTFSISSGALPPGSSLIQTGPRSAAVVGVPTTAGLFVYTITATRVTSPPFVISATDTLYVFGITNADSLPNASTGVAYGPVQLTVSGGIAPITFTVVTALPTGFSLSGTGELTGDTSSIAGDYTFDVKVTDAEGGQCTQTVSLSVIGCTFACGSQQNIALTNNASPSAIVCDQSTGILYGIRFAGPNYEIIAIDPVALSVSVVVNAPNLDTADLVWHPTNGFLYAATPTFVQVINPATMSIVNTVPIVTTTSCRMSADPDNGKVYLCGQDLALGFETRIWSFDINALSFTQVAVGSSIGVRGVQHIPASSTIFGSGNLLAAGNITNQLTLYRESGFSVAGTYALPGDVFSLAYMPDQGGGDALLITYLDGATRRIAAIRGTAFVGTTTSAPFNAPALGANIQISVVSTDRLIPGVANIGGTLWTLISVDSATLITVRNDLVAPGTPIAGGTLVIASAMSLTVIDSFAVLVRVYWAETIGKIVASTTTDIKVYNPNTFALECTYAAGSTTSFIGVRADSSGTCKIGVPWDPAFPAADAIKIFG